jgi:hypothetical protein
MTGARDVIIIGSVRGPITAPVRVRLPAFRESVWN